MLNATSTMAIPITSTARATRSYSSQCRVRMCPYPCSTTILRDWTVDGPRRLACDDHHIMSLSGASSRRCGRAADDHGTNSPGSGERTAHHLSLMIAPFLDQFIETASKKFCPQRSAPSSKACCLSGTVPGFTAGGCCLSGTHEHAGIGSSSIKTAPWQTIGRCLRLR
jgi:hypothetical protein